MFNIPVFFSFNKATSCIRASKSQHALKLVLTTGWN
jgi:hypothetical protein